MIELERDGDVFVLRMDAEENRLSPDFLHAFNDALATVEEAEGPKALVTTGTGKFFSNGLDLDWLGANPGEMLSYLDRVHRLYARILHLPCVTVAACNGHTFAAGAMLAIAHDRRFMRADRGYWCLPEVDLGMPFTAGMNALIPAMVPAATAREAMVTGRRYDGAEALEAGIVHGLADEASVLADAVAYAQAAAGKAGPNLGGIRAQLYAPVLDALTGNHA
ncbi:enoyl-CoA hydratase/isomerase family protein [Aquihabitans sp. G128]|uniref:enoyl-CoA hydratase/isomerase family protein n=1 Tax=Aquihabitans sp. G128 TaxID=2849779 RepID=UPI001C232468|nr:enoyl-CoA hydratase/isomerase family protein [Aquihabitans sp. G128]QXC59980.1 enoyl-CoA hydratase/isomerase family protein [Aquihabitans sp. G128]